MRWLSNLLFRLRAVLTWRRMRHELDDEVAFHLEMETRKHVGRGMSERDARRLARRAFGNEDANKERAQDAWGVSLVHDLRGDLAYAFRQLRRNPAFTGVSVLTLALGVGAATAVFSVVNAILLKPLPYTDADRLVAVLHTMPGIGADETPLSPGSYFIFRDESRAFEEVGLYKAGSLTVSGFAEPERVEMLQVTDGLFPLLRVSPILGRGYSREDVAPGSTYPVILSFGYWQRRFGGRADVVGETIRNGDNVLEIIGVMPREFQLAGNDPALYLPLVLDRSRARLSNYSFPGIARLRPGATVETARAEAARLIPVAVERYGGRTIAELEARGFGTIVRPLKEEIVGDVGSVLWVLLGTVGLVLLIACANVANLFLVRAEHRRREMAMRTALGASQGRVTRQLLTESLALGLLGGAAGLGLAYAGLRVLIAIAPADLPRVEEIAIEPVALAFTLGVSLLTGILFGLVPVLRYRRPALAPALGDGARARGGGGRDRHRLRNAFATTQVALAFVLLVGSGLMTRSFRALLGVRPGFERPGEVLTLRLTVPSSDAPSAEEAARMHEQIIRRIEAIPGVVSVGAGTSVAMSPWDSWDDIHVEGRHTPEGEAPVRRLNWIAPDYFATLRNALLAGRDITWDDIYQRRAVVMITDNLAREYWGDPSRALGNRISENEDGRWREIIGVVANEYTTGVDQEPPTIVYFPFMLVDFWGSEVYAWRGLRYAIRVAGADPTTLLPSVRQAVWSVNPNMPLADVRTLKQIRAASMARSSFALVLLGVAAAVGLVLGAVGVFGVISFVVSRRTREFGVRLAVGARQLDITRLVLGQGAGIGAIGLGIGLAGALALTRLMSALLFGVTPTDPLTYAAVASGLVAVILLASYLPARRAAHLDPVETLRWE